MNAHCKHVYSQKPKGSIFPRATTISRRVQVLIELEYDELSDWQVEIIPSFQILLENILKDTKGEMTLLSTFYLKGRFRVTVSMGLHVSLQERLTKN